MLSLGFWILVAVLLCAIAEAGICLEKWSALSRAARAETRRRRDAADAHANLLAWERSKGRV